MGGDVCGIVCGGRMVGEFVVFCCGFLYRGKFVVVRLSYFEVRGGVRGFSYRSLF